MFVIHFVNLEQSNIVCFVLGLQVGQKRGSCPMDWRTAIKTSQRVYHLSQYSCSQERCCS